MDHNKDFLDLKAEVAAQAAQVAAQAAEIASLKARLEGGAAPTSVDRDGGGGGGATSRRQLFKLAGVAAVGAAGASLASAAPAGATTGTMIFGTLNNAGHDLTELVSDNGQATLRVDNTGTMGGPALIGFSTSGYGLQGQGGLAPLLLLPAAASGPPLAGAHLVGEVFVDHNGGMFQCLGAGTPGTWVRVGFNPVPATRIVDTRPATHIGSLTGPIGSGQTVSIPVAASFGVPEQASAVVINATVTEGTAASFLTIWPKGATRPNASNLNWAPGETVANLVIVGVGTGFRISIFNNAGDVQLVLDLAGFYS